MSAEADPSLRQKLGCWLHERWCAELVLRAPSVARVFGLSWLDLCNRFEKLTVDSATGGRVCCWPDSSRLTVARVFPETGRRLLAHALTDWPIKFGAPSPGGYLGKPEISFIIPYGGTGRRPQLELTLAAVMAQQGIAFEVLVVEQSEVPTLIGYLPTCVRYRHQVLPDTAEFNKGRALNFGASVSRGDLLVVLDADYLVPARFAAECARVLARVDAVRPVRLIFYLDQASTELIQSAGCGIGQPTPEYIVANNPTPLAVRKSVYKAVGGHDEDYWGWGGEDLEFLDRLRTRVVAEGGWLPVVHVWHRAAPKKANGDRNRNLHDKKMAQPPSDRIASLLSARRAVGKPFGSLTF